MNRYNVKSTFLFIIMVVFASCSSNLSDKGKDEILLSDKNATHEAKALYNNLYKLSGKHILVGHQDALAYGMGWKGAEFRTDINDVCGQHPAIFGWDLGHIGDSVNIDSVPFESMKRWAIKVYEKGGINTFGWHGRNFNTGGSSWDITPCVTDILPDGKKHTEFLKELDLIADFFGDLKNSKGETIPVLFRPFHEMNGSWFWWGVKACTPEEYKSLWRFTVDYLRNKHNLNNIIYIYSTDVFETQEQYLAYYPGDEFVDVLGYDDYKGLNSIENTPLSVKMIETLADLGTQKGKLYTISETGLETIPNEKWFTQVLLPTLKSNQKTLGVSYVLFWRNGRPDHFYAPYPGHTSVADFVEFTNDTTTLFLSDLNNIYSQK